MNEEKLKKSDDILKKILGEERFKELSDFTLNVLDNRIGKKYCEFDGAVIKRLTNKFIVHIGYTLAQNKTIEDFENMCSPIYKVFIYFNSIQEFYDTYKEYIDDVKLYYKNDNECM